MTTITQHALTILRQKPIDMFPGFKTHEDLLQAVIPKMEELTEETIDWDAPADSKRQIFYLAVESTAMISFGTLAPQTTL